MKPALSRPGDPSTDLSASRIGDSVKRSSIAGSEIYQIGKSIMAWRIREHINPSYPIKR